MLEYIKVYDNVLDNIDCNKLIKGYEENLHKARMIDSPGDKYYFMKCSDNLRWDSYSNKVVELMQLLYKQYRQDTGMKINRQVPDKYVLEDPYMEKYNPDHDFRKRIHSDSQDSFTSHRFLSMTIYLNSVSPGGETDFTPNIKFKMNPLQGSVIIFPSYWGYYHKENSCSGQTPKYTINTHLKYL
jgi:hypothetical protein